MPSEKPLIQPSESARSENKLTYRLFSFAERLFKPVSNLRDRIRSIAETDAIVSRPHLTLVRSDEDSFGMKFEDEFQKHVSTIMTAGFNAHFYRSSMEILAVQMIEQNPDREDRIIVIRDHYLMRANLF